jgi:hypothetical protein
MLTCLTFETISLLELCFVVYLKFGTDGTAVGPNNEQKTGDGNPSGTSKDTRNKNQSGVDSGMASTALTLAPLAVVATHKGIVPDTCENTAQD